MAYAENLLIWYNSTLELITERINEENKTNLTKEEVFKKVCTHYKFEDNSEIFDLVLKKGITLYNDIKHIF